MSSLPKKVRLTIDGNEVSVPEGTNLIEAAKICGVDIPHYCYHKDLSVAGNCRMCQVVVEGARKMEIACNTVVREGMVVHTQETSKEAQDAQRATLEFILINHPLDCTICDQAGHCKLQDYYYEYNSKASRFSENKVEKVKAEPLGPEIVYDGERCIVCTRCVRFCDEVTKTSELGVFNRGDKSVIGISPERPIDNPLSGNVVDLCPVGALTHSRWRFNSRIWYTDRVSSVCPGCSTGCNVEVCARDGQVVHIKSRYNEQVNGEWMCDEGRYGFDRFTSKVKNNWNLVRSGEGNLEIAEEDTLKEELLKLKSFGASSIGVFISPYLTLEDMWVALRFANKVCGIDLRSERIAVQYVQRSLSELEKIVVSPDYAPNIRAAQFLGLVASGDSWREDLARKYQKLLSSLESGVLKACIFIGDFSIRTEDITPVIYKTVSGLECSISLTSRVPAEENKECWGGLGISPLSRAVLPTRNILEKTGSYINSRGRLQKINLSMPPSSGSLTDWGSLQKIGNYLSVGDVVPEGATDERGILKALISENPLFKGVNLLEVSKGGVDLTGLESRDDLAPGSISELRV